MSQEIVYWIPSGAKYFQTKILIWSTSIVQSTMPWWRTSGSRRWGEPRVIWGGWSNWRRWWWREILEAVATDSDIWTHGFLDHSIEHVAIFLLNQKVVFGWFHTLDVILFALLKELYYWMMKIKPHFYVKSQ